MADDVLTPASGAVVRSDQVTSGVSSGALVQFVKQAISTDGSDTPINATASGLGVIPGVAFPVVPSAPFPVDFDINATARMTATGINANTSGDTTLVAGASGTTTRVHKLWLVANAAVGVKFRDGTTDLHPVVNLPAGGAMTLDFDTEPWFVTTASAPLALNLSAAAQVSGRLHYVRG